MSKKTFRTFGKLFMALAVVLFAVIAVNTIRVKADNGETVRVSTAKELKAAMKNAEVGTIIFRTKAYQTVTIKADKAAKSKSLIIDAPNTSFTNKAVFYNINILNAKAYTEAASGNNITLSDCYLSNGIIVAKKKKVKSLTVIDSYGTFSMDYTLRKGAKLNKLELVYAGELLPVKSSYNKSKKTVTLDFTDYNECQRKFTIKLDKNGRVSKYSCVSNWVEYTYDYTYKYDSNGNLVKMTGTDNDGGKFTTEYTYTGNALTYYTYTADYESGERRYNRDSEGRVLYDEYNGKGSMDGIEYTYTNTEEYEYDKEGRVSYERWESPDSGYFSETVYTYDSKGFLTETWTNNSGSESINTYKYNKAGDLISETYTSEGYSDTTNYTYDDLGYLVEM